MTLPRQKWRVLCCLKNPIRSRWLLPQDTRIDLFPVFWLSTKEQALL